MKTLIGLFEIPTDLCGDNMVISILEEVMMIMVLSPKYQHSMWNYKLNSLRNKNKSKFDLIK
jgi:hypothetical protein